VCGRPRTLAACTAAADTAAADTAAAAAKRFWPHLIIEALCVVVYVHLQHTLLLLLLMLLLLARNHLYVLLLTFSTL
jgi:hypothetical protein